MARNGSGTYSLPEAAFVYDTVISETAMNSNLSDIASALTQSLAKDGQTNPTANLPMATYRHTGVGNASARNDYAAAGQAQDSAFIWCGTAGGTADAITLSPTPAITAYAAGQKFRWIAGASPNTGAATVAVSGLTTKALENDGSALAAGDHAAGKIYEGVYDGTAFQITRVRISADTPGAASTSQAGIVELATTAETQAGTDTARAVTPDGLADITDLSNTSWMLDEDTLSSDDATKVPSQQSVKAYVDGRTGIGTPSFTSSEQTVTVDTKLDVAHGLGAAPLLVHVVLRCKTTDAGYSVGDEISYSTNEMSTSDAGATIATDATNVSIVQGAAIQVHGKSSFNNTTLTTANWRWVVRAWA